MAKVTLFHSILSLLMVILVISTAQAGTIATTSSLRCNASSTGKCLTVAREYTEMMWMDMDINNQQRRRRVLGTGTIYISYGAMMPNVVVQQLQCSRPGASYYNCESETPANPFTRGCITITRCRS